MYFFSKERINLVFCLFLFICFCNVNSMHFVSMEKLLSMRNITIDQRFVDPEKRAFEEQKDWLISHGCSQDLVLYVLTDTKEFGGLVLNHEEEMAKNIVEKIIIYVNSHAANFGGTIFHDAVSDNNVEIINMLFQYCKNETIDSAELDGTTPLYWACFHNNLKIVNLLIDRCTTEMINKAKDRDGWTPTTWAIYNCNLEIVKLLIKNGAVLDEKSKEFLSEFKKDPDGKTGRREILEFFESKEFLDLQNIKKSVSGQKRKRDYSSDKDETEKDKKLRKFISF